MPLDPDLSAFLELIEAGVDSGARPLHELPIAEARRQYDVSTSVLDSPGLEMARIDSIRIPCRDRAAIDARLYVPVRPHTDSMSSASGVSNPAGTVGDSTSALLYFHGGGYCVGSLDSHDSLCRSLAALTPCRVLSVAYRLAPEHPFPTAVQDAQDAYLWLLSHGSAHGVDTGSIAVGGDSAGATLATGLSIVGRDAGWPQPVLQVLLYPCTSAWQDTDSHRRLKAGYLLEAQTLQWMFSNYLRNDADRADWRFAPLEADDLGSLPPAFIALAEYDPLLDEGIAYAGRLKAAGVDTSLKIYKGMTHDFARLGNIVSEADRVREDIATALGQTMRRERVS